MKLRRSGSSWRRAAARAAKKATSASNARAPNPRTTPETAWFCGPTTASAKAWAWGPRGKALVSKPLMFL
jgi:hypothetical protein